MLSPLFHVKQQNVYQTSKNAFSQTRSPEKKNQGFNSGLQSHIETTETMKK